MSGVTLIGPVSRDIVRMPGMAERRQVGGAVYYAGMALRALEVPVHIITRASARDADDLLRPLRRAGAAVDVLPSQHTCCFINDYGPGRDERRQEVLSCADPFLPETLPALVTDWIYFAPLIAGDISAALIDHVAKRGAHRIALDVQGLTRRVQGRTVTPQDWPEKAQALPHIAVLKADAAEAAQLTGHDDPALSARILAGSQGTQALVTLEGSGAVICRHAALHRIPACRPAGQPWPTVDTTGCGDTFLAAYLSQIIAGGTALDAAKFAAAAAALKLTAYGPLRANRDDIRALAARC